MPFVNYGGPCADTPDIEHALLDRARAISRELKLNYLEIRSRRHLGDALPCNTHKVSLTLALRQDPDVLWKAFKTGHRQEIRRGYKHGFVARFGGAELLEPFYEILSESWRNLGTPLYNRHYFRSLLDDLPGRDAHLRRLRRRRAGRGGLRRPPRRYGRRHVAGHEGEVPPAPRRLRALLGADQERRGGRLRPLPPRPLDRRFRQRGVQEEVERLGRRSCTGTTSCPTARRCRP